MIKGHRTNVFVGALKSRCFLFFRFLQMSLIRGRKPHFHVQGIKDAVRILFQHSKTPTWRSKQGINRSSTVINFGKKIHLTTITDCLLPIALCYGFSIMRNSSTKDEVPKSDTWDIGILEKSTGFFTPYSKQWKKNGTFWKEDDKSSDLTFWQFASQCIASFLQRLVGSACNHCLCEQTQAADVGNATELTGFTGCWLQQGIQEEDLTTFLGENKPYLQMSGSVQEIESHLLNQGKPESKWEDFLKNDHCTVYRRLLPSGIYEYRLHATFNDISARQLFETNLDFKYRKAWDDYTIDLDVIDSDSETSSDLVQWITYCLYPFSPREYIYLRRLLIKEEDKVMVILQRSTDDINIPKNSSFTRVGSYESRTIIKPHNDDFDEKGCDYLITCYEDPDISVPSWIMDFVVAKGIALSVVRMQNAALRLEAYQSDE